MLLEALFREPSQNVLCLACIVYLSSTDVATVALIVLGVGIDRCVLSNSQLDSASGDETLALLLGLSQCDELLFFNVARGFWGNATRRATPLARWLSCSWLTTPRSG
jgi:hypothetical protein